MKVRGLNLLHYVFSSYCSYQRILDIYSPDMKVRGLNLLHHVFSSYCSYLKIYCSMFRSRGDDESDDLLLHDSSDFAHALQDHLELQEPGNKRSCWE